MNLAIYYGYWGQKYFDTDSLIVKESIQGVRNKKILVLGEGFSAYKDNSLASPYLNWSLAKNHFNNLKFYEVVIAVHDNLKEELPEVIIDESKAITTLFQKVPFLSERYESCGKNTYCLKKTEKN